MVKNICAVILTLMVVFVLALTVHAKTLRLQCAYLEGSHVWKTADFFAKEVEKATNGSLKVEIYAGAKVLMENSKAMDAMTAGDLDLYAGSLLYWPAKVPEGSCQWLPFNWQNADEARNIFFNKGYLKILSEAVGSHNVAYLAPLSVATMGLMTTFPISKLEDLKGKNIRAVGLEAKIVEALGATAQGIGPNDQLQAMKEGKIAGTDFPWYTMEEYKFDEVLKCISAPAIHTPGIVDLMASKKVLASLSAEEQKAIEQAARKATEYSFEGAAKLDTAAVAHAKKKNLSIVTLSMEEQARFRSAVKPLWEGTAAKSSHSAKLVEILMSELLSKGYTF